MKIRRDVWISAGLFLITVTSRIPFRSEILYHWDSVNFAFATQRFDVAAEQPQPPGYIAYVWLCRLVGTLFHDPQTAMVWLSVVGSGLAVVAMYLLGRAMFGTRSGVVAALFMFSSPLFWFYGEIALPHTLDLFLVTVSAWLLYEVMMGQVWATVPAAAVLAVAGGLRQQTPVFLSLLALFAAVRFLQRVGWGRGWLWGVLAVAVFGLLCVGWFFPLVNSVGGWADYRRIVGAYSDRFYTHSSVFHSAGVGGLFRNLRKIGMYTFYGWSVLLAPVVVYGLARVWRRQRAVQWERVLFLLAWLFPAMFFYTLIHMGQQGLIFVFLPVLLLTSAQALVRLVETRGRATLVAALALFVIVNAALFAVLPEYPLGRGRFKVLSWDTLCNNDVYYQERFDAIREHFPPESTAIVADRWRHVQWYLPEYKLLRFRVADQQETDVDSAVNVEREVQWMSAAELGLQPDLAGEVVLVIFDPELRAFNRSYARATHLYLNGGDALDVLTVSTGEHLFHGPGGFGIGGD